MGNKLVLGLDFGSDSVRAVLVDSSDGGILNSRIQPYARWGAGRYCDPDAGQFRQHPLDYLEAMEAVIRGVLDGRDAAAVTGIGIDTTASTPCALDRQGVPLALHPEFADDPDAMFQLWKDHTALAEAEEINAFARRFDGTDYLRYSGGSYSCEWFWAKILHTLRRSPRVRAAAWSWAEHGDWIAAELTGRRTPEQMPRGRCAAGHKAMWHASWGGLPEERFLTGIDPLLGGLRDRLYTRTDTADRPTGRLTPEWAARLGLSTGVTVGGSVIDCHAGAVGAGIAPGVLVKAIGTSTCDILVEPELNRRIRGICGQVDGSVLPGMIGLEAGQAAFGDIYNWFRRLLGWGGAVSLPALEAAAAETAPGAGGVLALDWWNGRRTPDSNQQLTGALFGLTLGTTAPMIFRALVEATAFGSRRIVERFREEGLRVERVVAVGGIPRKSPFTMQICADVLNMPIQVTTGDQGCALGAAILGAAAAGCHPDLPAAMAAMHAGIDAVYRPDPRRTADYDEIYRRYLRCGEAVEQVTPPPPASR